MLDFANTFLNSIQYSHDNNNNNEKRIKGGFPMSEYGENIVPDKNDNNNIIYGGDDGLVGNLYAIEGGSFVVPIGLVYFPPSCDYEDRVDHNKNHEFTEDISVISDKRFDSLFALVSSSQKSNTKSSLSRKNRLNPSIQTKKKTKK